MENPYKVMEAHIGEAMTYPALCKLISEDAKSGKARELHIKKLSQYINIDRESAPRKLIVREVYLPENFKLQKPRGKTYPHIKNILLESLQDRKSRNVTTADLLRVLDVVPEKYIVGAYMLDDESLKYTWKTKKQFREYISPEAIAAESRFTFFMVTRSVINEILRSSLRQLHSKGLINVENSLCLIRHETQLLDGMKRTITKKHFLTEKEREDYLQLQKLIERRYQVDIKKLFYAKSNTMDEARDDFQEEMEEFVAACEYETYVTSNIITITELGLTEKLGNSEESRNMLKIAIDTTIINRCYSELALAMPTELLERFFVDYLNIHRSSI